MIDFRMLVFAFIFGGQYNTISQIERILVAFYLVYLGNNNDLLPSGVRDFCKFLSLIYFSISIIAALINSFDYFFQ